MVVKATGGASILDETNYFRIGQKNITALRKIFWKNNVMIDREDTGKNHNRTVRLSVSDGRVLVRTAGSSMVEL
jgi:chemotaxis protein CheD